MSPRPGEPPLDWSIPSSTLRANTRTAVLPFSPSIPAEEQYLFNIETSWASVTVVNGNVHILPGVPSLFKLQLDGLKSRMLGSGKGGEVGPKKRHRVFISTPLSEASMADYLTDLNKRIEGEGIRVGVYKR